MEKENEIEITDQDTSEEDFSKEDLESEDFDWKAKALELKGISKRRATQLGKAKTKLSQQSEEIEKLTPEEKSEPQDKEKSDEVLLKRLDNLALKTAGIKEPEEVELFEKWKEETGREADDIIGNNIFKKELEEVRSAKANQEATSNVKGEQGESGVKNTPDYWIAKATKGEDGKLRFPEETPKEMYSKILDKLSENEPGTSEELKFYNK